MTSRAIASVAVLGLVVTAAGCGTGDNSGNYTSAQDPSTTAVPASRAPTTTAVPAAAVTGLDVSIRMSEFAFTPSAATAKPGKVVVTTPNVGQVAHELVLLKTDADPARLPKKGGKVDESTSVGEIADVAAGATKKGTFNLKPGRYVMVCALPGHYEGGMYGTLTVR